MNIGKFRTSRKAVSVIAVAALLSFSVVQTVFAANTIGITTINGKNKPFSFDCNTNPLFNPVTLSGSGTGSTPPGNIKDYAVQILWGDGQENHPVPATFTPSSGNGSFSFNFSAGPHTYTTTGNKTITAKLYHSQPQGEDGDGQISIAIPVCVFAPSPATLHLIKHVVNTGGGTATASNFTLHLKTGSKDVANSPAAGAESPGTAYTLAAGSYVVSENPAANYTPVISGDCDANGNITLTSGQNKTCTITNTFVPPAPTTGTITVTKVVTNDNGGTATVSSFPLFVGQTSVSSGQSHTFNPGTYTVSETNQTGYAATFSGDCNSQGSITLAAGQNLNCTITNNDIQPKLTVVKVVNNDAGGQAVFTDFPLFVNQTAVTSGTATGFNSGTYTVSETNLPGYVGTFSGACNVDGRVTLAIGDNLSCTLTNTFNPPAPTTGTLTVIKTVTNNNGGTKHASDFTLHLLSGQADVNNSPFPGSTTGTSFVLDPGTYNVNENSVTGYTQTGITGDCDSQGNVTIAAGQNLTCTVINDDVQPTLTVTKIVSGGTKQVSDFPLTVGDTSVTSGVAHGFDAGTYTVSETSDPNYIATFSGDCSADTQQVILAVGDNKSCTITNTFKTSPGEGGGGGDGATTGNLIVKKVVINQLDPSVQSSAFMIHVSQNGNDITGSPQAGDATTGNSYQGVATGNYTISETGPSGYTTSFDSGCPNGVAAVVANQTTTCTITNTWDLVITKEKPSELGQASITITWTTNHDATSRVVYDTVSHPDGQIGSAPNYGYAFSTTEDSTLVTNHSVVISGLTPGSTYFFRAVSHGSPEIASAEISAATSGSTGPIGGGGSGGGGGGSAPTTPTPAVLGANTGTPPPSVPTGPAVLGATTGTLPRTGAPITEGLMALLVAAMPFVFSRSKKLAVKTVKVIRK